MVLENFKDFILNEKYINWFVESDDSDEMFKLYADAVQQMIDISYKDIGGYMGNNYSFKKDIVDDSSLIKISKKNGVPIAFRIYRDKFGHKAICSGTDGSVEGKAALKKIFDEDIKFLRSWSEVNDKLEYIFVTKYGAERVPNSMVTQLINKPIQPDSDGFHYTRNIGGYTHRKCIITGSTNDLIKKLNNIENN